MYRVTFAQEIDHKAWIEDCTPYCMSFRDAEKTKRAIVYMCDVLLDAGKITNYSVGIVYKYRVEDNDDD